MRKPIGQLFLSLVLSIIGSLVLMFLLPSFGMEPEAGSETEAGVLIAIVIVVVLFAQGALQSVIATAASNRSRRVHVKKALLSGLTRRKDLASSRVKMAKMSLFITVQFVDGTVIFYVKERQSITCSVVREKDRRPRTLIWLID